MHVIWLRGGGEGAARGRPRGCMQLSGASVGLPRGLRGGGVRAAHEGGVGLRWVGVGAAWGLRGGCVRARWGLHLIVL